jgi:hypothetical protein
MSLESIREDDWQHYEWTEVSEIGRAERMFIRGKRRTYPPSDGYHYERIDSPDDNEYRWERIYEVSAK